MKVLFASSYRSNLIFSRLVLCTLLASCFLSGCTSIITATRKEPIGEDYNSRTAGAYIDDQLIETKAIVNLKKTDKRFKAAQVYVDSYNGVVLLTGNVPVVDMREIATNIVQKIRKVRRVHNELEISPPRSFGAKIADAWLSTKVKTRLLFSKQVRSGRVHLVTKNGVIFLMGLVGHKEADTIVEVTKKSYGLQKIVRVFEYVD